MPIKSHNEDGHEVTHTGIAGGQTFAKVDTDFSVPLVPCAYFKEHLTPLLHPDLQSEVDSIIEALISAGDIVVRRRKNGEIISKRWKWFAKDPSKVTGKEDEVFAAFATIATRVGFHAKARLRAKGSTAKQTAEFLCNPTMTPRSTNRDNAAKPDSYAVRLDRPAKSLWDGGVPHWDDIIMPGEKKKRSGDKEFNDNNEKIMWSLTHGMRETVNRRFMFGYTIEDANMRLWFASRSDIIVSEQFNFITDYSELVHLFLSIMFANPVDLGYDPSVSVKYLGDPVGKNVYHLSVHWTDEAAKKKETSVFQAMETVANIGADVLRGRGTRVWRGYGPMGSEETKDEPIVVKDCWIDFDRTREGKILSDILEAAVKKDKESPVAKYASIIHEHFLEVVCHGDVMIKIGDVEVPDDTYEVIRRGVPLPDGENRKELPLRRLPRSREPKKPPVGSLTVGGSTTKPAKQKSARRYHDKVHYRIVFRSRVAAKPIDTVNSVQRLLTLLFQVLEGISALHELGWIHRDLSAGNILAEGTTGPAKIVDLEFCKRIDDQGPPHDGRTGTPFFIPIEIENLRYCFLTPHSESNIDSLPEFPPDDDASDIVSQDPDGPDELFTANPLHDLESFWWLAVYLTLPRSVVTGRPFSEETQEKNERWATSLFNEAAPRLATMKEEFYFHNGIKGFHPSLNYIGLYLESARKKLIKAYHDAELNYHTTGIDVAATMTADHEFRTIFRTLRNNFATGSDRELSKISKSYLRQSTEVETAKPAGGSLDPRRLLRNPGKHRRDSDDSDDGLQKITRGLNVLASPSREAQLRRSKRLRKREPSPLPLAASGAGEPSGSKSRVEVEDTEGDGTDDGSGSDE